MSPGHSEAIVMTAPAPSVFPIKNDPSTFFGGKLLALRLGSRLLQSELRRLCLAQHCGSGTPPIYHTAGAVWARTVDHTVTLRYAMGGYIVISLAQQNLGPGSNASPGSIGEDGAMDGGRLSRAVNTAKVEKVSTRILG